MTVRYAGDDSGEPFYMYILEDRRRLSAKEAKIKELCFRTTNIESYRKREDKLEDHGTYKAIFLEKPDLQYATDRLNGVITESRKEKWNGCY